MVAPVVAAAGVAALGSAIGGIAGGKGAKKAANAQLQGQRESNALAGQIYNSNAGVLNPIINQGNTSRAQQLALLGLGPDTGEAGKAFDIFKGSTGYASRLEEGLKSVNNRAFAGGLGQSGAALKALQDRGDQVASGEFGDYFNRLGSLSAGGLSAAGALAGVGTAYSGQVAQTNSSASRALAEIALAQGQNVQNTVQGIANAGSFALGSSYAPPGGYAPNPYGVYTRGGEGVY